MTREPSLSTQVVWGLNKSDKSWSQSVGIVASKWELNLT